MSNEKAILSNLIISPFKFSLRLSYQTRQISLIQFNSIEGYPLDNTLPRLSKQIHISTPIKVSLSNETNVSNPIKPECSGDEAMLT